MKQLIGTIISLFFLSDHVFCQEPFCAIVNPSDLQTATVQYEPTLAKNVPVFFHIIISSNNIGDVLNDQLTDQINVLNSYFANAVNVTFFLGGISRTINDNWRDIDKYSYTWGPSQHERDMKNALAIDTEHALNIYITSINVSTSGWGIYPWDYYATQSPYLHGIVLEPDVLPRGSHPENNLGGIAVHEAGHYFGLYHTFFESGRCQNFDPDEVSDTPPHLVNRGCPDPIPMSCDIDELDPIHNQMNYTNDACRNQFTTGQYIRMNQMIRQYRSLLGGTTINLTTDISIPSGDRYDFFSCRYLFAPNKKLIVNGKLFAIGSETNKITFDRSGSSGTWGGIQFNSGSTGTVGYCNITNASIGIKAYNSSPLIYQNNIEYCGTGVDCDYYSSPNLIYNNIRNNSSFGVHCNSYSSPNFLAGGSYTGYNVIRNNSGDGVDANYYCNPVLGNSSYGHNSIYSNGFYELAAGFGCTVQAQNNFWGTNGPAPTDFYTYYSTINYTPYLTTDPNPNRLVQPSDNKEKYAPALSITSTEGDELNSAEEKQKEGKYDEAINLFLEVFKKEKENSRGRYALIKIEECFTQAGKKDFLDFSKKELKQLIKEETELYVVLLELETHQLYNMGYKDDAMNNLKTILKKYNYNTDIEKQTLYRIGAFNLDLYNDTLSAEKTFDELAEKYPDDELLTYANMLLNEERYNKPNAKKSAQLTETVTTNEELLSNNPNPFNPTTIINYRVPENSLVTIKVYDVLGKEVATLVNEQKPTGNYTVNFDASNLSSGIYFYTINAGKYSAVKKMLLLK